MQENCTHTYKVTLLDCNGKELQIARYIQILTNIEERRAKKVVSNLPIVLFNDVDEEVCAYLEEVLDFYGAKYQIKENEEMCEIGYYPSCQVIALGLMVEYIGQRTDYMNIARRYGFKVMTSFQEAPYVIRDRLTEAKAEKLKKELINMGMTSQIIRSASKPDAVASSKSVAKKKGIFGDLKKLFSR